MCVSVVEFCGHHSLDRFMKWFNYKYTGLPETSTSWALAHCTVATCRWFFSMIENVLRYSSHVRRCSSAPSLFWAALQSHPIRIPTKVFHRMMLWIVPSPSSHRVVSICCRKTKNGKLVNELLRYHRTSKTRKICRLHRQRHNLRSSCWAHNGADALYINSPISSIDSTHNAWMAVDRLATNWISHDNCPVVRNARRDSTIFQSERRWKRKREKGRERKRIQTF